MCAANDITRFERTREGEILMHSPTGGFTSTGNAEITFQLNSWWKTHRQGRVFDSNGGFYLADSSMLTPDAAFLGPEKLKGLSKEELTGFPHVCPDFVIELLSVSDNVTQAKQKMERWIENGAALGWLIDPYRKTVYVYESGRQAAVFNGNNIQGTGPVAGFILDLDELWRRYEI